MAVESVAVVTRQLGPLDSVYSMSRTCFWVDAAILYVHQIHLSADVTKELKNCSDSENVAGGQVPVLTCGCRWNRSLSLWRKQERTVESKALISLRTS